MFIKVLDCNDPMLWYNKRIGEIFEVCRQDEEVYWTREGGRWNCLNWIDKKDCEVIPDNRYI